MRRHGRAECDPDRSLGGHVKLKRLHAFVLDKLCELAYEVHTLHRIWYKGAAQYRHMVWWRPLQRVKRLGALVATGPLSESVPLARQTSLQHKTPRGAAPEDQVLGVQALAAIAAVYAACWNEQAPEYWQVLPKHTTPPNSHHRIDSRIRSQAYDALARLLDTLMNMKQASRACYARSHAHLVTPPAPMYAPTCMALMAICARICTLCELLVRGQGPDEGIRAWCRVLSQNELIL